MSFNKIQHQETEEVAQCMLCKPEDLSLIPSTQVDLVVVAGVHLLSQKWKTEKGET